MEVPAASEELAAGASVRSVLRAKDCARLQHHDAARFANIAALRYIETARRSCSA